MKPGSSLDAIKLSYQDYERIAQPPIEDLATKLHPIKPAEEEILKLGDRNSCVTGRGLKTSKPVQLLWTP
jgi:hypothetical protein